MEERGGDGGRGERDVVLPGEAIGVIEEYIPGRGVYVDGGVIRSAHLGYLRRGEGKVNVDPVRDPPLPLERGWTVVGTVWQTETTISRVRIDSIVSPIRVRLKNPVEGILLRRVSSNAAAFPGDVVLARVEEVENGQVVLSLVGRREGVIRARCPSCGAVLRKVGYTLVCPECGKVILDRKISEDYGLNPFKRGWY